MEEIIYRVGKSTDSGVGDADWKWNWWGSDPIKAAARYGVVLETFAEMDEDKCPDWKAVYDLTPNSDERLVVTHEGTQYWCVACVRWVGDDEPEGWSTYLAEYKKYRESFGASDYPVPDFRGDAWYEDFLMWRLNGCPVDWANNGL